MARCFSLIPVVRSGTYDSGQATRPSARDRVTGNIWGADPESVASQRFSEESELNGLEIWV